MEAVFGDMTGLLSVMADNSALLLTRKFSRDYEREADMTGWEFMIASRLNPKGMIDMFKKLEAEEKRLLENHPMGEVAPQMSFLSTHPEVRERIDYLEKKLAMEPDLQLLPPSAYPYVEFQEKLRAQWGKTNN
jgi:predicted Zn-dependent protease